MSLNLSTCRDVCGIIDSGDCVDCTGDGLACGDGDYYGNSNYYDGAEKIVAMVMEVVR